MSAAGFLFGLFVFGLCLCLVLFCVWFVFVCFLFALLGFSLQCSLLHNYCNESACCQLGLLLSQNHRRFDDRQSLRASAA